MFLLHAKVLALAHFYFLNRLFAVLELPIVEGITKIIRPG